MENYGPNIMGLGNDGGRHTGAYRLDVLDALDRQHAAFLRSGGKDALPFLNDAIGEIQQGIRNGSIKPYKSKDVWTLR